MSDNLFGRLIKYQSTRFRSNLENYLTEILCDYLNRLNVNEFFDFVRYVLFNGKPLDTYLKWKKQNRLINQISWKSQYSFRTVSTIKYPDLVCICNEVPLFVIEAKLNAGFTSRDADENDDNRITISQLEDYGMWLQRQNHHAGLIFLTGGTSAPPDFLTNNSRYGIAFKNIIYWQNVYNFLNANMLNKSDISITRDFMSFLEENKMASESPNHKDFSVLDIFIDGSGKRIGNTMKNIREQLEKNFPDGIRWRLEEKYLSDYSYYIEFEEKTAWSWAILESDEYTYLGWGIVFPTENGPWDWHKVFNDLPKVPFIFTGVFSSGTEAIKNFKDSTNQRPPNWLWAGDPGDDGVLGISTKPLFQFLDIDRDFSVVFSDWILKRFNEGLNYCNILK